MLKALQELHESGYIHQDVKLDNFRIKNNQVKILDFGLVMEYRQGGKHKALGNFGF